MQLGLTQGVTSISENPTGTAAVRGKTKERPLMKVETRMLVVWILLATLATGVGQTEFVRMPNLPNNSTYSFGCAWGERRAEI